MTDFHWMLVAIGIEVTLAVCFLAIVFYYNRARHLEV